MKLYLICLFICPLLADLTADLNIWFQKCEKPTLANGKVRIVKKGRNAKFKCNQTFQLLGEMYATCLRGQWDKVPICVKSGCAPLPQLINGEKHDTYRGAVVTFICYPGYTMFGSSQIYCDGTTWNGSMPQCSAPDTGVQTTCDFELPSICGWTQDPTHTFNWSRQNFQTPTRNIGTGPLYDHTLGKDGGGYYMFIETSSPRVLNDTARLISPVFSPTLLSSQPSCFIFWYHMYGATTGILNIYVKPEDVPFGGTLSPKFTKSGNQGDEWYQGFVLLPNINQPFQVIVEALRGASYVSDIAIDDVKITTGSECEDLEVKFTSVEPPIQTTSMVSTVTKNMTATYPPPPPLPPLPPYPSLESFTEHSTVGSAQSTFKTTSIVMNNPQSSDKGISASTTVGPKYIIPTEPTPIILIPFSLRSTARPTVTTASPNMTTKTIFRTAETGELTTRTTISTTMLKTVPPTTTRIPTTKILPSTTKPPLTTTSTTVRKITPNATTSTTRTTTKSTIFFRTPKQTTTMSRPIRKPITTTSTTTSTKRTTTSTTTTTTRKPITRPTRRTNMYTVPKLTRAPTTLSSTTTMKTTANTILQDKSFETNEVIESHEKPARGTKWKMDRRGPIQKTKEELSFSSIVGILVAVILIMAASGIATYFYIRRRQRVRRQSSIAEDSDVRFLTSDEVLDFSLARPMDDDL